MNREQWGATDGARQGRSRQDLHCTSAGRLQEGDGGLASSGGLGCRERPRLLSEMVERWSPQDPPRTRCLSQADRAPLLSVGTKSQRTRVGRRARVLEEIPEASHSCLRTAGAQHPLYAGGAPHTCRWKMLRLTCSMPKALRRACPASTPGMRLGACGRRSAPGTDGAGLLSSKACLMCTTHTSRACCILWEHSTCFLDTRCSGQAGSIQ